MFLSRRKQSDDKYQIGRGLLRDNCPAICTTWRKVANKITHWVGYNLGYSPALAGEYSVERDVLRPIAHERKDLMDYKKHHQFYFILHMKKYIVQFQKISILPPQKGLDCCAKPKNLKKCMKLNWNFQRGWGVFPSVGKVWIFSGITLTIYIKG